MRQNNEMDIHKEPTVNRQTTEVTVRPDTMEMENMMNEHYTEISLNEQDW